MLEAIKDSMAKVLHAKYGGNWVSVGAFMSKSNSSNLLKRMVGVSPLIQEGTQVAVENEHSMSFNFDKWVGNVALVEKVRITPPTEELTCTVC